MWNFRNKRPGGNATGETWSHQGTNTRTQIAMNNIAGSKPWHRVVALRGGRGIITVADAKRGVDKALNELLFSLLKVLRLTSLALSAGDIRLMFRSAC